jgi:hypothetical protein
MGFTLVAFGLSSMQQRKALFLGIVTDTSSDSIYLTKHCKQHKLGSIQWGAS